jgi:hypothetical protein
MSSNTTVAMSLPVTLPTNHIDQCDGRRDSNRNRHSNGNRYCNHNRDNVRACNHLGNGHCHSYGYRRSARG